MAVENMMEETKSASTASPGSPKMKEKTRVPAKEMFELLLLAREGKMLEGIPVRPHASPVDPQTKLFYVYETEQNKHMRSFKGGTVKENNQVFPVKFSNIVRSRCWWSPDHGERLGISIRKMGLITRVGKDKKNNSGGGGAGGADRHGLQGAWVTLLERPTSGKVKDKAMLRDYVVENIPSLVILCKVGSEYDLTPLKPLHNELASMEAQLEQGHQAAYIPPPPPFTLDMGKLGPPLTSVTNHSLMNAGVAAPTGMGTILYEPEFEDELRYFDELGSGMLGGSSMANHLGDPDSMILPPTVGARNHDEDAKPTSYHIPVTSNIDNTKPLADYGDSTNTTSERSGKNPAFHALEENDGVLEEEEEEVRTAKKKVRDNSHEMGDPEDMTLLSTLLDDEEADDCTSPASRQNKGSVGSSSPNSPPSHADMEASMVAYDLFRRICDTFTGEEFSRWYKLHARSLFTPEVSQALKWALDTQDPRISRNFMFSPTDSCSFLPDKEVGTVYFEGSYSTQFVPTHGDQGWLNITQIQLDKLQTPETLYEDLVESKLLLLCSHLFFKQLTAEKEIDPNEYWYHHIVCTPNGKRMVLRGFIKTLNPWEASLEKHVRTMQIQDVSEVYQYILSLPKLVI